jgi:glutamate--cysteine ligase
LFTEHAHKLLKELEPFAQLVHKKQVLEKQIAKIDNQDLLPSTQVLKELESKSFADYGFELAKKYHHMFCSGEANKERHQMLHRLAVSSLQEQHNLELRDSAYISGYEDLEISTQMLIKEALKRKVEVEVLDRYDNFIRLRRGRRTKFVKQATQTNVDSQVSYFMMENKTVSKIVLNEAGVAVAGGKTFYEIDKALDYAANLNFEGSVIIKPTHTNYGKGITVVEDSSDKSQMRAALKTAFSFGQAVLIEEYIQAKEYRFLVIGGKCRAVLHREPANVLGDGVNTIKHLVEAKNADPAHFKFFKGYEITLGQTEKEFLAQSGLDFESVPKLNEKIYLRSNSNVSTGGDAHDLTFEMDESYKKVAQAAAKAAKAEICGVDMMIKDITQPAVFKAQNRFFKWIKSLFTRKKAQVTEVKPEFDFQTKKNYAVIEINFNPNLQIHGYPVSGQTINVAGYVLDLLGFK